MKNIIIGLFILAIILILVGFRFKNNYEYYTFNDKRGTSRICTQRPVQRCSINGVMIEVKQFYEIK